MGVNGCENRRNARGENGKGRHWLTQGWTREARWPFDRAKGEFMSAAKESMHLSTVHSTNDLLNVALAASGLCSSCLNMPRDWQSSLSYSSITIRGSLVALAI